MKDQAQEIFMGQAWNSIYHFHSYAMDEIQLCD